MLYKPAVIEELIEVLVEKPALPAALKILESTKGTGGTCGSFPLCIDKAEMAAAVIQELTLLMDTIIPQNNLKF